MSDGDLRLYAEQEPTIVLSHADIRRLAISNTDVLCAVENVLAAYESDLRQLSLEGPRSSNGRRRAMIFAGLGIGDAALAVLVDDRARRAGLGWRGVLGPAGAV